MTLGDYARPSPRPQAQNIPARQIGMPSAEVAQRARSFVRSPVFPDPSSPEGHEIHFRRRNFLGSALRTRPLQGLPASGFFNLLKKCHF
jgi:hypothetical protein